MKKANLVRLEILLAVMVIAVSSVVYFANAEEKAAVAKKNTVQTIESMDNLKTFAGLLKPAGMVYTLDKGKYTIFAPDNAAFEKLGKEAVEKLMDPAKKDMTQEFVAAHIVEGSYLSSSIGEKGTTFKDIVGNQVTVQMKDGKLMVNGATVTKADIECANGVVYVIDSTLTDVSSGKRPKDNKDEK